MTMDDWVNIMKMTNECYQGAWVWILVFIAISNFVIFNLIVATSVMLLECCKQLTMKKEKELNGEEDP